MGTRNAVRATERELACPICWDKLTSPVQTECGHTFCEVCIRTALEQSGKECPVCRHLISTHRSLRADSVMSMLTDSTPVRARIESQTLDSLSSQSWICSRCTVTNVLAAGNCIACGARRPAAAVRAATPSAEHRSSLPLNRKRAWTAGLPAGDLATWTVGQRVEAKFQASQFGSAARWWFPGEIASEADAEGRYDVRYDDGDYESSVRPKYIRDERPRSKQLRAAAAAAADGRTAAGNADAVERRTTAAEAPTPSRAGAAQLTERETVQLTAAGEHAPQVEKVHAPSHNVLGQPQKGQCWERCDLDAQEARALAEAEGLPLIPSPNASGFKNVHVYRNRMHPYSVNIWSGGKMISLGLFRCPEAAALCYARHLGRERAMQQEEKVKKEAQLSSIAPLTAQHVRKLAAAEGLTLVRAPGTKSGFRGVTVDTRAIRGKTFEVNVTMPGGRGAQTYVGRFATAEEGALAHARYMKTMSSSSV